MSFPTIRDVFRQNAGRAKSPLWTPTVGPLNTKCWIWKRGKTTAGYGLIRSGGRDAGFVFAHRLAYEIHTGASADKMSICHRCDTPSCVRPEHLFLGAHSENMADAATKGRSGGSKLTLAQVGAIRAQARRPHKDLADEFGVSRRQIWYIVNRKCWRATHRPR